ncbi:OGFOD2, partial [Symbiodinium necroappetens]
MEPAVASDGGSLRFAVGARVSCNMGREGWASGEIVATRYREDHWPPGKTAPYQVKLDLAFGGALIYAPADFPQVIRAELPSTFSIPEEDSNPERTLEVLHKEIVRLRDEPGVIHVSEPELMGVAE